MLEAHEKKFYANFRIHLNTSVAWSQLIEMRVSTRGSKNDRDAVDTYIGIYMRTIHRDTKFPHTINNDRTLIGRLIKVMKLMQSEHAL
jgi:hypothetical protein